MSLSKAPTHPTRTALTSFLNTSSNKLQIVDVSSEAAQYGEAESARNAWAAGGGGGGGDGRSRDDALEASDFVVLASASHAFPPTKVDWEPVPGSTGGASSSHHGSAPTELLATTGDVLRIWALEEDGEAQAQSQQGGHKGAEYVDARRREAGGMGWRLRERSKLSNVRGPGRDDGGVVMD